MILDNSIVPLLNTLIVVIVLLISAMAMGGAGVLWFVNRVNQDKELLKVLREQYQKGNEQQKAIIDTMNNIANMGERLAYNVIPVNDELRQIIDQAEDIFDAIVDEQDNEPSVISEDGSPLDKPMRE